MSKTRTKMAHFKNYDLVAAPGSEIWNRILFEITKVKDFFHRA